MLGGHIFAVDHHVFLLIWLLQRLLDDIDCDEKFDIPDWATQNGAYALHCRYESKNPCPPKGLPAMTLVLKENLTVLVDRTANWNGKPVVSMLKYQMVSI